MKNYLNPFYNIRIERLNTRTLLILLVLNVLVFHTASATTCNAGYWYNSTALACSSKRFHFYNSQAVLLNVRLAMFLQPLALLAYMTTKE